MGAGYPKAIKRSETNIRWLRGQDSAGEGENGKGTKDFRVP